MKSALSLTLVVCFGGSTLAVAAQEWTLSSALSVTVQEEVHTTAGPISRAITVEAGRLAATSAPAEANQRTREPVNATWSRVRRLKPGTEIMMTANGSQPGKRYVLSADEAGITLLNLADLTLAFTVRE